MRIKHLISNETLCVLALAGSLCFGVALSGCGASIIDDRYAGPPLHQATGTIVGLDTLSSKNPLRASLFWSPDGHLDIHRISTMFEDNSVKIQMEFPSSFRISVFKPPKKEWMVPGAGYAVGAMVVYEDTVGQGRFIPGRTPIRGGAPQTAIFYSPQPIHENSSPFRTPIGPGMMHLELPLPCGLVTFPKQAQKPNPTCNADMVGSACSKDSDCAPGGICLHSLDEFVFKNGYCSKPATPSCHPPGTVALESIEEFNEKDRTTRTYLLKSCIRDTSCRKKEGYTCDAFIRGCIPASPIMLEIREGFQFSNLCFKEQDASQSENEVQPEQAPQPLPDSGPQGPAGDTSTFPP